MGPLSREVEDLLSLEVDSQDLKDQVLNQEDHKLNNNKKMILSILMIEYLGNLHLLQRFRASPVELDQSQEVVDSQERQDSQEVDQASLASVVEVKDRVHSLYRKLSRHNKEKILLRND